MYGYIYKTTCLVNNKIYIGQKKSNKFLNTKYLGSGVILNNAIKLYGKENFKTELLCWCKTFEELNNKEKEYIKLFNSMDVNVGYNLTEGGQGTPGHIQPESQKLAVSKANSGRKFSNEARKKMSISKTGISIGPFNKGLITINNGIKNIMIDEKDFSKYEKLGYTKGLLADRTAIKTLYKQGEYMYKINEDRSITVKFVKENMFKEKLIEGFLFGKKPREDVISTHGKDYSQLYALYL